MVAVFWPSHSTRPSSSLSGASATGRGRRCGLRRGLRFSLLGAVFIPPLVDQSRSYRALPNLVDASRRATAPSFLERKYRSSSVCAAHTEQSQMACLAGGIALTASGRCNHGRGSIIIAFLTFFMLLEGPEWRRRCTELFIPEHSRGMVERIGAGVYRSVGGFVTEPLASLLAGLVATIIMLVAASPTPCRSACSSRSSISCHTSARSCDHRGDGRGPTVGVTSRWWRWDSCRRITWSRATRCDHSSTAAR